MLSAPRVVWLMVPAGDATEETIEEFAALLAPGDTIVDGGNANLQGLEAPPRAAQGARHPLRRCRHQRRHLGPGQRLRHDGRRRRRGSRAARAASSRRSRPPTAATSTAARRAPVTTSRWSTTASSTADAGLRRGLRDPRTPRSTRSTWRAVAEAWMHGTVIRSWLLELLGRAFEQHGDGPGRHPRLGGRLGRGPLDGPGGDRPRRAGARSSRCR